MHHLNLFLEASGRREHGADGFLKLLARLEEVIGGGGGDSNKLHMLVDGETNFCKSALGRAALM